MPKKLKAVKLNIKELDGAFCPEGGLFWCFDEFYWRIVVL
jgi:hypothetical protein